MSDPRVMDILKKVEKGEISPDEATKMIGMLEDEPLTGEVDNKPVNGSTAGQAEQEVNSTGKNDNEDTDDTVDAANGTTKNTGNGTTENTAGRTAENITDRTIDENSEVSSSRPSEHTYSDDHAGSDSADERENEEKTQAGTSEESYGYSRAGDEFRREFSRAGEEIRRELGKAGHEIRRELGKAREEVNKAMAEVRRELNQKGILGKKKTYEGTPYDPPEPETRSESEDQSSDKADTTSSKAGEASGSNSSILDDMNSLFTGIGQLIRDGLRDGFGWNLNGTPKYEFKETREGTFGYGVPRLDFNTHNGSIELAVWDKETYFMEVKKIVNAESKDEAEKRAQKIRIEDGSEGIRIWVEGPNSNGLSVDVRLKVPATLKYNGILGFHNGKALFEGVIMTNCAITMHNGKCDLRRVSASSLTADMHNGNVDMSKVSAEDCKISMHNGKVNGDIRYGRMSANAHNGKFDLKLSSDAESNCSVAAHNGTINLELEKADDTGYRVDYRYFAGKGPSSSLIDNLKVIEHSRPRQGAGETHFIGETDGFAAKQRKMKVHVNVHNGKIDIY